MFVVDRPDDALFVVEVLQDGVPRRRRAPLYDPLADDDFVRVGVVATAVVVAVIVLWRPWRGCGVADHAQHERRPKTGRGPEPGLDTANTTTVVVTVVVDGSGTTSAFCRRVLLWAL